MFISSTFIFWLYCCQGWFFAWLDYYYCFRQRMKNDFVEGLAIASALLQFIAECWDVAGFETRRPLMHLSCWYRESCYELIRLLLADEGFIESRSDCSKAVAHQILRFRLLADYEGCCLLHHLHYQGIAPVRCGTSQALLQFRGRSSVLNP